MTVQKALQKMLANLMEHSEVKFVDMLVYLHGFSIQELYRLDPEATEAFLELTTLRVAGKISREEYADQRRELISRIDFSYFPPTQKVIIQ